MSGVRGPNFELAFDQRSNDEVPMLDWPYAHLLVNHFSVILTYVGLAAVVLAVVRPRRALWLYAFATLTLAGLAAYPAVFTGERAAPVMERKWFVDEAAVDDHEQAGERAQWILFAMGALSAYGWWRLLRPRGNPGSAGETVASEPPLALRSAVFVTALAGAAAVAYASYEGGYVVHKAPRLTAPPASAPSVPAPPAARDSAPITRAR